MKDWKKKNAKPVNIEKKIEKKKRKEESENVLAKKMEK